MNELVAVEKDPKWNVTKILMLTSPGLGSDQKEGWAFTFYISEAENVEQWQYLKTAALHIRQHHSAQPEPNQSEQNLTNQN